MVEQRRALALEMHGKDMTRTPMKYTTLVHTINDNIVPPYAWLHCDDIITMIYFICRATIDARGTWLLSGEARTFTLNSRQQAFSKIQSFSSCFGDNNSVEIEGGICLKIWFQCYMALWMIIAVLWPPRAKELPNFGSQRLRCESKPRRRRNCLRRSVTHDIFAFYQFVYIHMSERCIA